MNILNKQVLKINGIEIKEFTDCGTFAYCTIKNCGAFVLETIFDEKSLDQYNSLRLIINSIDIKIEKENQNSFSEFNLKTFQKVFLLTKHQEELLKSIAMINNNLKNCPKDQIGNLLMHQVN